MFFFFSGHPRNPCPCKCGNPVWRDRPAASLPTSTSPTPNPQHGNPVRLSPAGGAKRLQRRVSALFWRRSPALFRKCGIKYVIWRRPLSAGSTFKRRKQSVADGGVSAAKHAGTEEDSFQSF